MEILFGIVGFLLGFIAACSVLSRRLVGTLRIDRSDPNEPPSPFLEINKGVGGVDGISRHKYVMLEVRNENYVSQE